MNESLSLEPPRTSKPSALARPGLVALVYGYRFLAGLLIALPTAALLGNAVAQYPRGDLELFDPGGMMLGEAFSKGRAGAGAVVASGGLVAFCAIFAGLLPYGALIAGLGRKGRLPRGFALGRASAHLGTLGLLLGSAIAAQAVLAALSALLGGKIVGALHLDPPSKALANMIVGVFALLLIVTVGVVRDLASVSAVNDGTRYYSSAARALGLVFSRASFGIAWSYGARALGTALVLALALAVDAHILETRGSRVLASLLLHQGAIAAAVLLRASWLAAAIEILDRKAPIAAPQEESAPEQPEPEAAAEEEAEPVAAEEEAEPAAAEEEEQAALAAEPDEAEPLSSPK